MAEADPDGEFEIRHNDNGTVTFTCTPCTEGMYKISVERDGTILHGLPVCFLVEPTDDGFITSYSPANHIEYVPSEITLLHNDLIKSSNVVDMCPVDTDMADTLEDSDDQFVSVPSVKSEEDHIDHAANGHYGRESEDQDNQNPHTNTDEAGTAVDHDITKALPVQREMIENVSQMALQEIDTAVAMDTEADENVTCNTATAGPNSKIVYIVQPECPKDQEMDESTCTIESSNIVILPGNYSTDINDYSGDVQREYIRVDGSLELDIDAIIPKCQPDENSHDTNVDKDEMTCDLNGLSQNKIDNLDTEIVICTTEGCGQTFVSVELMKAHVVLEHQTTMPRFVCEICSKVCRDKHTLKKHYLVHTTEKPFVCEEPNCGRSFKGRQALISHMTTHGQGDYSCPVCNKLYAYKDKMLRHLSKHDTECQKCLKSFRTKTDLEQHMPTCDGQIPEFSCNFCGKSYHQRSGLLKHIAKCHHVSSEGEGQSGEGRESYSCKECGKTFSTLHNLSIHMGRVHSHKWNHICQETGCKRSFPTEKDLQEHHQKKHTNPEIKSILCKICGVKLLDEDDLLQHTLTHVGRTLQCDNCGKMFKNRNTLRVHRRDLHGIGLPGTDKDLEYDTDPNVQFLCVTCGENFQKKSELENHLLETRHGTLEIPCDYEGCSEVFPTTAHMRQHCIQHTRYACDVCGKQYKAKGGLTKHMEQHLQAKWTCTDSGCHETFATKSSMKRHVLCKHKSADTGFRFICPDQTCERQFHLKDQLKQHVKSHSKGRNYTCSVCNKGFKAQNILNMHARIHSRDLQHQCELCERTFIRRYQLTEHISMDHSHIEVI